MYVISFENKSGYEVKSGKSKVPNSVEFESIARTKILPFISYNRKSNEYSLSIDNNLILMNSSFDSNCNGWLEVFTSYLNKYKKAFKNSIKFRTNEKSFTIYSKDIDMLVAFMYKFRERHGII